MPARLTALRYLTRFTCTGGDCPDNCCFGMKVMLTPQDRARLQGFAAGSEERRARVEQAVEPAEGLGEGYVAVLRTGAGAGGDGGGGGCRMLDADRLCAVHRAAGEAALPTVCAQFPRVLSRFESRRELSATLACPEAARLCLTAEDSLDVVDAPELPWGPEPGRPGAESPYSAPADEVHAAVGEVLRDARFPVALRVALVGELGRRTDAFFHAGAASVDRAALSFELHAFRTDASASAVAERLRQEPWPATQALQAVMGLFASLPEGAPARAHLVPLAVNHYLSEAKAAYPALGTEGGPPLWEVLWGRVQVRRQFLHGSLGGAVEAYLARFLLNDWHRE
ncbi:MAG TPA: flagellin lysine-N-methylase, partial [Myxococcales bacterium]|nr:flagellin lysine-N-methylase [Myxococcales bacterium]